VRITRSRDKSDSMRHQAGDKRHAATQAIELRDTAPFGLA
jgi:hypothetical protein